MNSSTREAASCDRLFQTRKPDEIANAARWMNVTGKTGRPANGGAINEEEAREVIKQLKRLVIEQGLWDRLVSCLPLGSG